MAAKKKPLSPERKRHLKRMQKAAQSPKAQAKRIATFKRNRALKNAEAAREFGSVHALSTGVGSTHHRGEPTGTHIPLDAIPDMRPKGNKSNLPAAPRPNKLRVTPLPFDPNETVQIVAGNFRITVERSKP